MEPRRALLTDNRSFCLWHLTTSLASIRADLASPLIASCFTVNRALAVAASSCVTWILSDLGDVWGIHAADLSHLSVQLSTLRT